GVADSGATVDADTGTYSPNLVSTVTVTPVNDSPVLDGIEGENAGIVAGAGFQAVTLLADAAVSDVDSVDFNGGSLTLAQTSGTDNGLWGLLEGAVTAGDDGVIAAGETVWVN